MGSYNINDTFAMVATDRLLGFDVVLLKGMLTKDKFSIKLQSNSWN
jgi:hypothetical protein